MSIPDSRCTRLLQELSMGLHRFAYDALLSLVAFVISVHSGSAVKTAQRGGASCYSTDVRLNSKPSCPHLGLRCSDKGTLEATQRASLS